MSEEQFQAENRPATCIIGPQVEAVITHTGIRCSDALGKLAGALAAAQLEFTPVLKQSENPAYKRGNRTSRYADLAQVIDSTRPALAKNGLVVIQMPQVDHPTKMLKMTTRLQHSSGEWIESDLVVPATQMQNRYDIQSIGSAMTYTRRYAWQAIVGVAAEEDDDGNAAAGVGSKEAQAEVAKEKLGDKYVPTLFYTWYDESQTAKISGSDELLTANRTLFKKYWNSTVGAIVVNGDQLEALKYELEQKAIPFKMLKEK